MQRTLISKFCPLLCDISRCGSIASPMLVASRSFQASPHLKQQMAPGKLTPKMAKLQKKFQTDNGTPVFLKGGIADGVLYRFTLFLCVLGTIGDVWLWLGYIIA
ncbi:cytochrome c oxidase subunit 7A1, mitochondrial [Drosophila sulfurigaster albostrigata]|uniref:Cytochrome c oxidase subunit 7A1, mitochondrial n=1 Tax=Drosophila albomicans TaxID=7291 RepID=A0A6P8XEE3_DROAB|nr:cytochrome c oxidase subunit 7A1, mitochondrial [Drosophila albomicans]XP_062124897.1 cytochrome c oxidase subunit 7A1, mitochondrial [Drosophila sulfurigaster albostrigata]